jgi:hypothetical protein
MSATYHIRIKQEYAAAIIEDLQKKDAVEFVPEEEAFEVPEWQKELVLGRIEKYKDSKDALLDEESFWIY